MAASGALTTKISIHAPREGSDITIDRICDDIVFISIHAPREGSDILTMCLVERLSISIHAPREGSDNISETYIVTDRNFNPRSP